jgi:pimeloyl-ACP methyl ester carboxylesterase
MTQHQPASARMRRAGPQWPMRLGLLGLGLGAAAVANHLIARQSERRHPARGCFMTIDGVRLHYLERGAGLPIVLLHGNAVTAEDFAASGVLDGLAKIHRVIAFDRPGFGYSTRPRTRVWTARAQARLLAQALARLNVERPVVVGHSWGTLVALNMGIENPGGVAGLVLASGYYRPTLRPDAVAASGPAIPVLGDLMRFTVAPALTALMTPLVLKQIFAPAPVSPSFRRRFPIALSLRPSQLRASAAEAALLGADVLQLKARLADVSLPTLIVGGRQDRLVSFPHHSEWLFERLGDVELLPIENAGHMVHYTASQMVTGAIETFALRLQLLALRDTSAPRSDGASAEPAEGQPSPQQVH